MSGFITVADINGNPVKISAEQDSFGNELTRSIAATVDYEWTLAGRKWFVSVSEELSTFGQTLRLKLAATASRHIVCNFAISAQQGGVFKLWKGGLYGAGDEVTPLNMNGEISGAAAEAQSTFSKDPAILTSGQTVLNSYFFGQNQYGGDLSRNPFILEPGEDYMFEITSNLTLSNPALIEVYWAEIDTLDSMGRSQP